MSYYNTNIKYSIKYTTIKRLPNSPMRHYVGNTIQVKSLYHCYKKLKSWGIPINSDVKHLLIMETSTEKIIDVYNLYIEGAFREYIDTIDYKHSCHNTHRDSLKDKSFEEISEYPYVIVLNKRTLSYKWAEVGTFDNDLIKKFKKYLKDCGVLKKNYINKKDTFLFKNKEIAALAMIYGNIACNYNIIDIMKEIVDKYPKSAIIEEIKTGE